jgi:hypothetical protein
VLAYMIWFRESMDGSSVHPSHNSHTVVAGVSPWSPTIMYLHADTVAYGGRVGEEGGGAATKETATERHETAPEVCNG